MCFNWTSQNNSETVRARELKLFQDKKNIVLLRNREQRVWTEEFREKWESKLHIQTLNLYCIRTLALDGSISENRNWLWNMGAKPSTISEAWGLQPLVWGHYPFPVKHDSWEPWAGGNDLYSWNMGGKARALREIIQYLRNIVSQNLWVEGILRYQVKCPHLDRADSEFHHKPWDIGSYNLWSGRSSLPTTLGMKLQKPKTSELRRPTTAMLVLNIGKLVSLRARQNQCGSLEIPRLNCSGKS